MRNCLPVIAEPAIFPFRVVRRIPIELVPVSLAFKYLISPKYSSIPSTVQLDGTDTGMAIGIETSKERVLPSQVY